MTQWLGTGERPAGSMAAWLLLRGEAEALGAPSQSDLAVGERRSLSCRATPKTPSASCAAVASMQSPSA